MDQMPTLNLFLRQANPSECDAIHRLVQVVADETFAYLFRSPHVPIGDDNWNLSWVAVCDGEIVGVTMTSVEYVTDLWVAADWRRRGIGQMLLVHSENEIRERGQPRARLRVVKSNSRAVDFYMHRGWAVAREFPHEKFGHAMFEMTKSLETPG